MADTNPFSTVPRSRTSGGAVFARLAHPFIGSSRPPSSSGRPDPTSAPNILNPRTIRYSLQSPILAISAQPDGENVVVAGREILRILRVGRTDISEVSTLRQPDSQRKILIQYDVKWGTHLQKSTIATAGTNGTICLYDAKVGIMERQLREHGRQVHKIAFNPADGRLLLSASQDGTIKLWDLREKKSRLTFAGRSDAVRDVQFNSGNAVEFAAAFDNGTIQRWDYRQDKIYERKINAHDGPVFSVDWHPDGKHCASGGRDRTVNVWDLYSDDGRRKPKHTISTMCSVSRIAWRPRRNGTTELATCAINNDPRVHVWDLKRPYIPARIIDEHVGSTTGILWKDEDILYSCSKDMTFVQNDVLFATQPINSLSHAAFDWGPTDDFTFAAQPCGRVRRGGSSTSRFETEEEIVRERRPGRSSSFKGLKPALSILETLSDKHHASTQASARVSIPGLFDKGAFTFLATRYIHSLSSDLGEVTLSQACAGNARAALRAQQFRTAQTWRILQMSLEWEDRMLLKRKRPVARALEGSGTATPTPQVAAVSGTPVRSVTPQEVGHLQPPVAFGTSLGSSTGSTDGDEDGQQRSHVHHIATSRHGDEGINSHEASVEDHAHKPWPDVAPLPAAPVEDPAPHPYPFYPDFTQLPPAPVPEKRQTRDRKYSLVSSATSSSYGTHAGFGGRVSEEEDNDHDHDHYQNGHEHDMAPILEEDPLQHSTTIPELRVGEYQAEEDATDQDQPWSPQKLVDQFVDWYCERGDVQMCATVVLLLAGRIKLEERRRDEWVEGYLQLLRRFNLFVPAAAIVKTTSIEPIRAAGGNQTFAKAGCGRCFKPITQSGSWYCERCQMLQDGCVICRETVKGRWTMCQTCSHGGHDKCLREWFFDHEMDACAAVGCDHECLPRVRTAGVVAG